MKFLVVQQKMIGDVLTSSILCESLKKEYPNSLVHYLIHENTRAVVENHSSIDKIICYDSEKRKSLRSLYKIAKELKKENYDWIIDAYGKIESNIITLFSKPKNAISYHKNYTSFIYKYTSKRNSESKYKIALAIEHRLNLLEKLVNEIDYSIRPSIFLTIEEIESAKLKLQKHNRPFMISVLGSSLKKSYPFEYMAKLLDYLAKNSTETILLNYTPFQKDDVNSIYRLCKKETQQKIDLTLYAKSLREFLAFTSQCKAVIGNEGGAINMAKALNIPTFAIFSPQIEMKSWSIDESKNDNLSVHINEFDFHNKTELQNKKDYEALYKEFLPEFVISKLDIFLKSVAS